METFIHLSDLLDLEKADQTSYRKNFDCGEPTLNDYLQKYAKQHSHNDVSQTHVLFDDVNKKVLSYYSASNSSAKKESLANKFGFPVKEIPAVLIGRLAVDKTVKGKGYGAVTLVEALKRVRSTAKDIGIKIVVVDALNESAKSFYKSFGFIEFDDNQMKLFMKTADIDAIQ